MERTAEQIKLRDGRTLGFAEFGDPAGVPIFFFHGFPGSRLDYRLVDPGNVALEMNARIIAVDRPGMGLSANQRGRKILDWPDDVVELAGALKIDRFAVLGISGGGPYAAACAFKIPERLTRTGIVCGMGPSDAPGMKDGESWALPGKFFLMRKFLLAMTALGLRNDPDRFLSQSKEVFSEPDRLLLEDSDVANDFVSGLLEAFRSGTGGADHEAVLYTRPWGFPLREIATPVHLWHGEQDANVPVLVGRHVAELIPDCTADYYPEEGHLTLPRNHLRTILGRLL